jgi:hypothetical protein
VCTPYGREQRGGGSIGRWDGKWFGWYGIGGGGMGSGSSKTLQQSNTEIYRAKLLMAQRSDERFDAPEQMEFGDSACV